MRRLLVLLVVLLPLSWFVMGCGGAGGPAQTKSASGPPSKEQMEKAKRVAEESAKQSMERQQKK